MAKRFIDTELFSDEWFMDLSKDCKLMWIYLITNCDHAGIISLNKKLCKFQSGILDIDNTLKQLGNRLLTINKGLIFIPKYLEFQYPNFPNSKVRQQKSAIDILISKGIYDKENLTLSKGLINSYEHEYEPENDNEQDNIPPLPEFLEYAIAICKKQNLNYKELKFAIESKYEAWRLNNWKDGYNKKIVNWKSKFNNTVLHLRPIKQQITERHGTVN